MTLARQVIYTDQQATAIGSRSISVGLSAGAGCGKTFVMTERFLSELEPQPDQRPPKIDELIAITFTDAAARELRDRIRRKCAARLMESAGQAASYWQTLMRSLDAARISTIHSFCGGLLRQFAFDLGLDPGFAVVQAAPARALEHATLADLLRELLTEADAATVRLVTAWGIDGTWERLLKLRSAVRRPAFGEWRARSAAEIVSAWQAYFANRYVQNVIDSVYDSDLPRTMCDALECVTTRSPADVLHVKRLMEVLLTRPTPESAVAHFDELFDLMNMQKGTLHTTRWSDKTLKDEFMAARKALAKHAEKLAGIDWSADEIAQAAELGAALLEVADKFDQRYRAEKRSRNALDFDDLLAETHRLATEPQFAPLIADLRKGVRLLMVDEFQDTDAEQVAIVRGLLGDELTSGGLFFVGDSKQSIYRFRGAEPRVFDHLRGALPAEGRLPLSQNFRSQPAILQFVNAVFADAFANYESLAPSRNQTTPEPAIELLWSLPGDDQPTGHNKWPVAQQRRHEARSIAQRLHELIEAKAEIVGCPVTSDAPQGRRSVKPGDIVILFRALSDVRYYEEALREREIDYYLVGGHAFYAQQEVYDVLHLLRCVASEVDEVALLGVLRSPWFGLADETIVALSLAANGLSRGLFSGCNLPGIGADELAKRKLAAEVLAELRCRKDEVAPAELLELAIERTAYDAATLAEFLGERKLANLEKLLEMARAMTAAGVGTLDDFVAQLDDFTKDPPREPPASTSSSSDDVVRLMTIHQSKGLEFPVVVIADANRERKGNQDSARFDDQLGPIVQLGTEVGESKHNVAATMYKARNEPEEVAEAHRMFYVAATRAADYLIVSSALEKFAALKSDALNLLAERYDLEHGECRVAPSVPAARVTIVKEQPHAATGSRPKSQLTKAIAAARQHALPLAAELAGIPVDRTARRQFSVTRLGGDLVESRPARGASDDDVSQPLDPLGLGTLVHAVLERIDLAHLDHIELWCKRLAPYHDIARPAEMAAAAQQLVESFCHLELAQQIAASPHVRREVEFLTEWPVANEAPVMIRGYIDLAYQDAEGAWWIVDYKTNQVTADEVPQAAGSYALQMHLYALVWQQLLGVAPRGMKLVFLRPGVVHEFAWDADARQRAIAMIDRAIAASRQGD